MRDRMFTLETSFPHFFIQHSAFDVRHYFQFRNSYLPLRIGCGQLAVDKLSTVGKKLLKIQHNRHSFSSKGGDDISDFRGCFISHIEVVDAM